MSKEDIKTHIEYTSAILRVYEEGSYEERSKFTFVATLIFIDADVYVKGGIGTLNRNTFNTVKSTLKDMGFKSFKFERHGRWKEYALTDDIECAKQGA